MLDPLNQSGALRSAEIPQTCNLLASLRFDRSAGTGRSARPIQSQWNGIGDWGFDASDFGEGGEWQRRRMRDANESESGGRETKTENWIPFSENKSPQIEEEDSDPLQGEENTVKRREQDLSLDDEAVLFQNETETNQQFQDIEGIIVSPNCGTRIVLAGSEIDLAALANQVVHFAFFFVLKGLFEVRRRLIFEPIWDHMKKLCLVPDGSR